MAFIGFKAIFREKVKPSPGSEPHRLRELEEARGQLLRVFAKDGFCIATFAWGCCSFPEELQGELQALMGQEVGILRLDGYHVRAVDDA